MKLYEVPRNSVVRLLEDQEGPPGGRSAKKGDVVCFKHIDGMYSLCYYKIDTDPVHLRAWAEVELVP